MAFGDAVSREMVPHLPKEHGFGAFSSQQALAHHERNVLNFIGNPRFEIRKQKVFIVFIEICVVFQQVGIHCCIGLIVSLLRVEMAVGKRHKHENAYNQSDIDMAIFPKGVKHDAKVRQFCGFAKKM